MNSRQRTKKKTQHTKEIHTSLLAQLREKLQVTVLYQSYRNDRTTFTLSCLPEWVFCFSADFYARGVMYLFGDHKALIDKFKPSRCFISCTNVQDFIATVTQVEMNIPYYTINALRLGSLFTHCEEIDEITVNTRYTAFKKALIDEETKKQQLIGNYMKYAKSLVGYQGPNYIITATGIRDNNLKSPTWSYDRFSLDFCCTDLKGTTLANWSEDLNHFVTMVKTDVEKTQQLYDEPTSAVLNMEVSHLHTTLPSLRKSSHYPVNTLHSRN